MKRTSITLSLAVAMPLLVSAGQIASRTSSHAVYRDPSATIETRVDDLIGRLTLSEKVSLLACPTAGRWSGS